MLQIISGKFFKSADRYRYPAKGITFANYSWVQPIETCVATLEPVDSYASVPSYVINYTNQLEKEESQGPGLLVRTGDSEIMDQFLLLCTFGLKAFFHQDRDTVSTTCREHKVSSSDYHVPSAFVPRFFLRQIRGSVDETTSFASFVRMVIGLPRDKYLAVIASIGNFVNALQVLGHNIDLAYSLIVYSLESLGQSFDTYDPQWEDYYEDVRSELDLILGNFPKNQTEQIRATLLRASNIKLLHRFIEFVSNYIDDSFFIEEAPAGYGALRKSELRPALRNAYYMRSRYAHKLEPIQQQLKHPVMANSDVIRWKNQPYLSMAGLVRLAHHSIMRFVERQEKVEFEDRNWRDELPGLLHVEMSPEYWIWKYEGLKQEHSTIKLNGFLAQLEAAMNRKEPLTDLKLLLAEYERLLPNSKRQYQLRMFTLYCLYNLLLPEENRCQNYTSVSKKYSYLFEVCTIEALIVSLILEKKWPWSIDVCLYTWKNYLNQSFQKNELKIPQRFEIAILNEIAKMFLKAGDEENYHCFIKLAILDAAGNKSLQSLLKQAEETKSEITSKKILAM